MSMLDFIYQYLNGIGIKTWGGGTFSLLTHQLLAFALWNHCKKLAFLINTSFLAQTCASYLAADDILGSTIMLASSDRRVTNLFSG